jgi:hypothetical protein
VNTIQKIIVVLGIIAVIYFGLINPAAKWGDEVYPSLLPSPFPLPISIEVTAMRVLIIAGITSALVYLFKDKKKEEEKH